LTLRFVRGLLRSRIVCVRAVRGSLLAQHLKLSHRVQLTPNPMLSVRCQFRISPPRHLPLCAAPRSLRDERLAFRDGLRIAPYAITSRPRVEHGLLRAQHFKLRTVHKLLCVRRLALDSVRGLLRSPCFAPGVARGLLRDRADGSVVNTSELCVESVVLRLRHLSLRPVSRLLDLRHLTLSYS